MSGGELVVIKRSGRDGMRYPLPSGYVTLGRDADCHIRVMLPTVSELHATVTVNRNQSVLRNVSRGGETLLNGAAVSVSALRHGDVITLGDRSLRWEYFAPAAVRIDVDELPPLKMSVRGGKGRRKAKAARRQRHSEAAPRRFESEAVALLDLRHRTSLPAAGGERQVAIVQPQRRGESAAEPMEIKAKVVPKQVNKRVSRSANPGTSNHNDSTRKSARGAGSPIANLDSPATTPRSVSPKKGAKRSQETTNKTEDNSTPAKSTKNTRNSKNSSENNEAKVVASTSKETPKKQGPRKDANRPDSLKKKSNLSQTEDIDTPRKSARKALLTTASANKRGSARNATPRSATKKTPGLKMGSDISSVGPFDLAAIVAQGTPKRNTPKGPFVHVATPRPKTPYVEKSPSMAKSSANKVTSSVRSTPRVNPLLRAATLRATPRSATKVLATPKTFSPKKRIIVQKIEDPTNIDAQKKTALMALTGRSPKKAHTPQPTAKTSPKFVIAKASIKKISPSRTSPKRGGRFGSGSTSKRKRVTGTPKLTPGRPVNSPRRYTSGGENVSLDSEAKRGQKRSLRNDPTANESTEITDLTKETPAKQKKSAEPQLSPSPSRSSRRSDATTPTIVPEAGASPRKSVLRTPSSPRKHESIKFDLSNLERERSESLPPPKGSAKSTPAKTRGRSSVTSVETTSEEDLLLRFSDESSESELLSPRRSGLSRSKTLEKSSRVSRTKSPSSKSKSPSTPRKSSRGSLLVQKVLETPIVVTSPSPSDRTGTSSYSRSSTLTKSHLDLHSSLAQLTDKTQNVTKTPVRTPNVTKSPRSTRRIATESYSIVDLVSINTTHSVDETTECTYDSVSSFNSSTHSRYRTPSIAKMGRQTSASRGQSMINLSLETSTPMVKNIQRLSTRKALLKSATIGSAIKRSKSTPRSTKKSSPQNNSTINTLQNRRSNSLTLSPKNAVVNDTLDSKRGSRSKSEIVIDDSALSVDSTITPNTRRSKGSTASTPGNTTARLPRSPKNTPSKSPKSNVTTLLQKTPKTTPNKSPKDSKTSLSPKKASRSSKSIGNSSQGTLDASRSPKRSVRSGHTPASIGNIATPNSPVRNRKSAKSPPRSSKSERTPTNKRQSASHGEVLNVSKHRPSSRGSKLSPRLLIGRHSGQGDGPTTPENETSPSEVGTPVLKIQKLLNQTHEGIASVKETIKRFESFSTPKTLELPKRVNRKTLGAIGERILARRSDLEIQGDRKGWTDPKKKGKGITKAKKNEGKINLTAVKKVLSKVRSSKRISDENSVVSDRTDENAPKPDNEVVITPKSTVQLVPEAVKGKHSTAKKPVSRKSIIDHLDISQDIVKNLFNSPVKRKLSQSMTQYSITQLSDDEASSSRRSKRSTFGKTPNVSFDFDSIKTPRVPTEMFVSPLDTPAPKSPNLVGVKRLYTRNTPRNDLSNLRGVKTLLKTPRARKSPNNDLTNVAGVKALLGSRKKGKEPRNDLTDISGVKRLLGSARKQNSPKNDLTHVSGVKGLFASGSKKGKSPKNDLRNIAGVKKLLKTPKGRPKSPKNDLSDVRGVRNMFRQNKSIRNALDNVSGVEELFGNSCSTIREPENTITEFDKLLSKTPLKSYSRAKSMATKKPTPSKGRPNKSLDANVSQSNVEEWLDKELEMRSKQSRKRLSKSFNNTPIKSSNRTPEKSTNRAQPKSARLERALKKLTIDAVGGDVTMTPGSRSRRVLTAEKSSYSMEVAKALTPTKKKLSIPEIIEERSSLPFKKRGHSNSRKSKTPQRKTTGGLNDSTEALGLQNNVERLSLPIKKRMLKNHGVLDHSTPVKNRRGKSKADDVESVDLGPVSPIISSPNVTPRKNSSLRDAQKIVQQASASIRSAKKAKKEDSVQETKATKKAPARGRKGKAQESTVNADGTSKSPSPSKPVPKTRTRRGTQTNDTTAETKTTPKKTTRGRKVSAQKKSTTDLPKTASPKVIIVKKSPIMSPQKSPAKPTRARRNGPSEDRKTNPKNQASPEKATKSRTRKGKNVSASTSSPTLVVSKKQPKLSPQKPPPKTTRGKKVTPVTEDISTKEQSKHSPKKIAPKPTRGRKAVPAASPQKETPAKAKLKPNQKAKTEPKATRGKKATKPQSPALESPTPVRGRRKRQNEDAPQASSPKAKPTRGRSKANPIEEAESPKNRRGKKNIGGTAKKHVTFAAEARAAPAPVRGGRRKAEAPADEPDAGKPQPKRSRGSKAAAKPQSPEKPAAAARRGQKTAAKKSPKAATATRATRQRK